jgi:uncharacterized protein
MPFSMSQASLPSFEISLNALSAILDKAAAYAAAKKIDPSVLLHTRLSPNMFDLARQVRVAADNAKNGSARLAGVEPPRYEDNETTIDQLKARLARTVAYLKKPDFEATDFQTPKCVKCLGFFFVAATFLRESARVENLDPKYHALGGSFCL